MQVLISDGPALPSSLSGIGVVSSCLVACIFIADDPHAAISTLLLSDLGIISETGKKCKLLALISLTHDNEHVAGCMHAYMDNPTIIIILW